MALSQVKSYFQPVLQMSFFGLSILPWLQSILADTCTFVLFFKNILAVCWFLRFPMNLGMIFFFFNCKKWHRNSLNLYTVPPAVEAWSPNHWTTREVSLWVFFFFFLRKFYNEISLA